MAWGGGGSDLSGGHTLVRGYDELAPRVAGRGEEEAARMLLVQPVHALRTRIEAYLFMVLRGCSAYSRYTHCAAAALAPRETRPRSRHAASE